MTDGQFVPGPTQAFALRRRMPEGTEMVFTSTALRADVSGFTMMSGPQTRGMAPDWVFDALPTLPEGASIMVLTPAEDGTLNATTYQRMDS